jgi:NAD(P)-dependent dehydrogenase (short-subunit alcohol dehydrogenase family)
MGDPAPRESVGIDLTDRVIIVTGGGRGIGRCCCELFARMGARVVIAEVDSQTGSDACSGITGAGGQAIFAQTDIADRASVERMRDETLRRFGTIDALVNNATVTMYDHAGNIDALSMATWRHMLDVTLSGALHCIQAVAPTLRARPAGRIVNFSSIMAVRGVSGSGAYQAAKAGIAALTRAASIDLADDGVLVNAVQPGWIAVSITAPFQDDPDWRRDWVESGRIPLRRMGEGREVAQLVAFLCSEFCRYVTGQVIPIDGGASIAL